MGHKATTVKIVPKSVKDIKVKAPKTQNFISIIQNATNGSYNFKIMILIPNILIQAFIQLDDPCPEKLASVFYQALVMQDDLQNTP
jgi:hypothetical protein